MKMLFWGICGGTSYGCCWWGGGGGLTSYGSGQRSGGSNQLRQWLGEVTSYGSGWGEVTGYGSGGGGVTSYGWWLR